MIFRLECAQKLSNSQLNLAHGTEKQKVIEEGWLSSRVVSVLDSGAEGPQSRRLRQTVHTRRASVHQAAKLVAALLRVARV